jgi:ketosteroid isomerase-like protein
VSLGADGRKLARHQLLGEVTGGDLRFESIISEGVQIRVDGDTAVETGRVTTAGKNKGRAFRETLLYTAVWVKRAGQWQLASEHACAAARR